MYDSYKNDEKIKFMKDIQCIFIDFRNFIFHFLFQYHPCYSSMVCPQVVDGGDDLQIWRVAANILVISSCGQ
jgi:hypothetical protein